MISNWDYLFETPGITVITRVTSPPFLYATVVEKSIANKSLILKARRRGKEGSGII